MRPNPQPASAPSPQLRFSSIAMTHRGRVRTANEDRVLDKPAIGLWAVADGMGGHEFGGLASEMVVEGLAALSAGPSPYAYLTSVREVLLDVNRQLVASASHGVMGSTVVALLMAEGHYACLWAGDSRAYRWRGGRLRQLTRDHSLVQDLVEAGSLQPHEARGHRQAHVLTRAVGASGRLGLDLKSGPVLSGDRYLLCSDGLTVHVADQEIEAALAGFGIEAAARCLMDTAMAYGGSDNVSIVIVDVLSAGEVAA